MNDQVTHSRYFSPSAAHRWLHCPGSAILNAGAEDVSSAAAEEGTLAHEIAATALTDGIVEHDDVEMVDYVRVYVDHVNRLVGGDHG